MLFRGCTLSDEIVLFNWSFGLGCHRTAGLEPGISLQKYSENTRELLCWVRYRVYRAPFCVFFIETTRLVTLFLAWIEQPALRCVLWEGALLLIT